MLNLVFICTVANRGEIRKFIPELLPLHLSLKWLTNDSHSCTIDPFVPLLYVGSSMLILQFFFLQIFRTVSVSIDCYEAAKLTSLRLTSSHCILLLSSGT